ncbi:MAG: LysM peptidoglycan-binding domain-containing protein [Chloroflexi bacterium]|nr:LysM peptidoglycan-binding domain-containing protein [Chloroflexota bacterium]
MLAALVWAAVLGGCALTPAPEQVIVITATFLPADGNPTATALNFASPTVVPTIPSQSSNGQPQQVQEYTVQAGDTLFAIAERYTLPMELLVSENQLENPDALEVGQVLRLPSIAETPGSAFAMLPDNRLVRGPGSRAFDPSAYIAGQSGYIRQATDVVDAELLSATAIVTRVSLEYSVDARLLLALLEYKGRWISQPQLSQAAIDYPLGAPASPAGFDRKGLYRQLTWAADNLNRGYYGWQQNTFSRLQTIEPSRVLVEPSLNAATVGVQYLLSLTATLDEWRGQVDPEGFYATYASLFQDPFQDGQGAPVPTGIAQPALTLPFSSGETWFFTGGPHGGWGSGSAWAAVDFAPPDDLTEKTTACYESDYFATAAADGVIARSGDGSVVIDLDGDGDESTGWTLLYLHIATRDRIAEGATVRTGDRIGRPSCEGGFSNGTHLHFARRYNGEWIPVGCPSCKDAFLRPELVMGNWSFEGLQGQEYQGYMLTDTERRVAEQGRNIADNQVSW